MNEDDYPYRFTKRDNIWIAGAPRDEMFRQLIALLNAEAISLNLGMRIDAEGIVDDALKMFELTVDHQILQVRIIDHGSVVGLRKYVLFWTNILGNHYYVYAELYDGRVDFAKATVEFAIREDESHIEDDTLNEVYIARNRLEALLRFPEA